jgi:hypothetical protein
MSKAARNGFKPYRRILTLVTVTEEEIAREDDTDRIDPGILPGPLRAERMCQH